MSRKLTGEQIMWLNRYGAMRAEPDEHYISRCPICGMRGTSWPPLSWLLRWHVRRVLRKMPA